MASGRALGSILPLVFAFAAYSYHVAYPAAPTGAYTAVPKNATLHPKPSVKPVLPSPVVPIPHRLKGILSAPFFYQCTEEKRQKATGNCGGRCDVVMIGDSLLECMTGRKCYWNAPTPAGAAWKDYAFHNSSVVLAGAMDETQHSLYIMNATMSKLRAPKMFFVLIGTNNIGNSRMGPQNAIVGVKAVIGKIQESFPSTKILVHTQLPRGDDPTGKLQSQLDVLDSMVAPFVRAGAPQLQLVNCSAAFPRGRVEAAKALQPDYLHPNAEGYRGWLKCLNPIITQAVKEAG